MLLRVVKTGMELFDACRAYGLGLILSTVSTIEDVYERVVLQDYGSYYQIEGPSIAGKNLTSDIRWLNLFSPSDSWARIFLTLIKSPTLNVKSVEQKKELEERTKNQISIYSSVLESNLQNILSQYSGFYFPEITTGSKKDFGTLLQSLEGSASKGFRRAVRDGYEEGKQIYAPMGDLALAYLGGAKFIHWIWGDSMIGVLPLPQRVEVMNHLEIEKFLESKFVNRVSVTSSIAHYAVIFAERIREKKASQESYTDRYSSLAFNAMVKTGNQWKPVSGGIFPLELLFSLVERNLHVSGEIFDIWDSLFNLGNMKGYEDLAQSLGEFISDPRLDFFEHHVSVLLRYLVRENVKVRTYPEECLREVMSFVG
ncbi:MAG: hypothetical protein KIH08_10590 [Candidatus Freyarchaeota archaeon]|nr:hypothetical protein [Candidatus Jordarchaeia archaeon]MBS7268225.1 hypothetical protein [Candidatus Jordarchaeia archaeon]MBS7279333.1 hypothetical protein [Candidatus Jordarchaeia archaeon]